MRMIATKTLVLGLLLSVAAGCSQDGDVESAEQVLIVDLDAVAKALGRDAEIAGEVEAETKKLNAELLEAASKIQQEFEAEKKKVGEAPSPEDEKRLQELAAKASEVIRNNRLVAQMRQQEVRSRLIAEFRAELEPIVEQLAEDSGARVAFLASAGAIWWAPSVDATGRVIDAMRAKTRTESQARDGPAGSASAD